MQIRLSRTYCSRPWRQFIKEDRRQRAHPLRFLEQILRQLKRHGIVQSRRGKLGGFDLLMPANRIKFAQILRILDGPLAPLPCLSRNSYRRCADCPNEDTCEVRRVFAKMTDSIREVLECTTIDDAIRAVSGAGSALKDPAARTSIL
jgi:Rrf2 family protein